MFLGPLEVGEEVGKDFGDMILVLGGGLKRGFEIGYSTEERLNLAVELYKQRKRVIVVSDGSLYKRSPAIKKIVGYLLERGVDRAHIRYEGESQTTYDNLSYAKKLVEEREFEQVIVCTSPYHQRRSKMIMAHLGLKNFKIARMARSEVFRPVNLGKRLRNMKLILREYFAIIKFKLL